MTDAGVSDRSALGGEHIVVGVDGSVDARRALEWALAHTRPGDSVEIVHTWHQPVMASEAGMAIDPTILSSGAVAVLDREMTLLQSRHTDLPHVTTRAVEGHPGAALLDAARDADLLVVGSRGHGGFVGLLLGSTSTYLAHHATCPLVIVPAEPRHR